MEEILSQLLEQYPLLAPFIFILARAIPIVLAPIPGLIFDFIGIAIFGWKLGLILALLGAHLGATLAFYIARYFRESAVKHFAPLRLVHEWEEQYSERQKFWMLVAARFITSPFFDYVSYAAGLTKISFRKYILSTLIGIAPFMFGIYYFGGLALYQGWFYLFSFFIGIFILNILLGKKIREKFTSRGIHTTLNRD